MNSRTVVVWLLVGVGIFVLVAVSISSLLSLHEARADRDQWESARGVLTASLDEARSQLAEIERSSAAKEKELLSTIRTQVDERSALRAELGASAERVEALEKQTGELTAALEDLTAERAALETAKAELAAEVEKLKGEVEARSIDQKALQETLAALRTLVEGLKGRTEASEKILLESLAELKTIKGNNDLLAAEVTKLTAELRETAGRLEKAEVLADRLRLERDRLLLELGRPGGEDVGRGDDGPPGNRPRTPAKPIEGTVAAVDDAKGLVVLDVGEKHGVRVGMVFAVLRDTEEVATLRADSLHGDYTGCSVAAKNEGVVIAKGMAVRERR